MSEGGEEERPFRFTEVQIRRKFKHALEFQVRGAYNRQNAALFADALADHVADAGTRALQIRYARGAGSGGFAAVCYVNEPTRLAVVTTVDGWFVTAYRLTDGQFAHVLQDGTLGGGD